MKVLIYLPFLLVLLSCSPENSNNSNNSNNSKSFGDISRVIIKELHLENTQHGFDSESLINYQEKIKKILFHYYLNINWTY